MNSIDLEMLNSDRTTYAVCGQHDVDAKWVISTMTYDKDEAKSRYDQLRSTIKQASPRASVCIVTLHPAMMD